MTLTELSIKRPTIIFVIFAVLIGLGTFTFIYINYELLPKISPPTVFIATTYPGASPSEVEDQVTKPVEEAVAGLDKIDKVTSYSLENVSFVVIDFVNSANADESVQNAQREINQILAQFPNEVKSPSVSKVPVDAVPVLRMGVTSTMESKEFYQFIKDYIQARLSKISGVGKIVLLGGDQREIKINIDLQKIRAHNLSLLQVTQSIINSSMEIPTGNIKDTDGQFVVKLASKISSLDELRNIIVAISKNGGRIKLSDIAEIQDGSKEYTNIARINGIPSVTLNVYKQEDANTVLVSQLVKTEMTEIERDYTQFKVKFNIASDGSTYTMNSVHAVEKDLFIAIILVACVMLVFLHTLRNSLIVMVAIPTSLISTFTGMYIFGFTLNLMTLLAMSLVIGILVDDSIVVLENIHRHLKIGKKPSDAALDGRNEIGFAALSITMVDVVVFVPVSLVGGVIGNMVRSFSLVIVFSTLLSLFVSFTITPLFASRLLKYEKLTQNTIIGKFGLWFEKIYDRISSNYTQLLDWSLTNKLKVVIMVTALFFAGISLIPLGFIGIEFMPQSDRNEIAVFLELPLRSTLKNTNFVTQQAEKIISELPEVEKIFVNVGASNEGFVSTSSNYISEIDIQLAPITKRKKTSITIGEDIRKKINIPGVKVRVSQIGIFGTANMPPVTFLVTGSNLEDVNKAAETCKSILVNIPGTSDVRLSSTLGKPETRIEIDRQKMAELGLSIGEVGGTLRTALQGNDDAKFRHGNTDYPIRIQLDEMDKSKTSNVSKLTFINPKGKQIELKQFATVYQSTGPSKLERTDRNYSVSLLSEAIGAPSGTIAQQFEQQISQTDLPEGIGIRPWGMLKMQGESFKDLGIAAIASLLFIYLIMVALYNNYIYPFVVMFSVPVALIGALLALALTKNTVSIFTILGLIMLIGLVDKNAILLVDRANQMKLKGLNSFDALLEAGKTRLRPILMTTVSMVFGMLPIAISKGAGSETKHGIAWVIIGGLISSMFLTLVLVPVVYHKVDQLRETIPAFVKKISRKLQGKKATPLLEESRYTE